MAKRNIYLGKSVKDVRKKGLDTLTEVRGIAAAIIRDYKSGRITKRTATSRMNLLKLIVMRDSDFQSPQKKRRAVRIVDEYRKKLEGLKMARKKVRKKKGKRKASRRRRR